MALLCCNTNVMAADKTKEQSEFREALKGFLPPTDHKVMKSLNGQWSLKVIEGITAADDVPAEDATWQKIPVPGCWEAYGRCKPTYNYPDSVTGFYRTSFTVPSSWRKGRVVLRFDGVLRGYHLWINGKKAGTWESGYNTCLWDITDLLEKGETQQLAMRVYSRFMGYEFDCFDDWTPMGIFRDVTLLSIPETHLKDMRVETMSIQGAPLGEQTADAQMLFSFIAAKSGKDANKKGWGRYNVLAVITDAKGHEVAKQQLNFKKADSVAWAPTIKGAHPWTAETPYLYTLTYSLRKGKKAVQHFSQKFGVRKITVDGKIIRINGRQVKFRGVNAHSTDPKTVKVISDELTLKDMKMMKEASVNYIRTSHYPREPRFYDLADSLGFYVVDEVPFGRGEKNLSKKSYKNILLTRAHATVARDKNRACVMIWSVGNENPLTSITEEVGQRVQALDHTRPMCYPQVGSYFRKHNYQWPAFIDVYAPHYPKTGEFAGFYQNSDRPQLFTEYCHTLGVSFEDHDRQWEIIQRTDCMAGGSVWEWADQGMPFTGKTRQRYGYAQEVYTQTEKGSDGKTYGTGGIDMYGNFGTDGLLYADRTPLPNYYELQHNYARAAVIDSLSRVNPTAGTIKLKVRNRYDFLNLKDNVWFAWKLSINKDTVATGKFSPSCAPHAEALYELNIPELKNVTQNKMALLHFTISDKNGLVFLRQTMRLDNGDIPSEFERAMKETMKEQGITPGKTQRSNVLPDGITPYIRVGRKATLAERLRIKDTRVNKYLIPVAPGGTSTVSSNEISVKADIKKNGDRIDFALTPDTTGNRFLSEFGLAMLMPASIDRVQWIGQGPFPTYPGRYQANRYGVWNKRLDDLYMEGNRRDVDVLWMSDAAGNGYLMVCDGADVSFEQTDKGLIVTYNSRVAGSGPKFGVTSFPVWAKDTGTASGAFYIWPVKGGNIPEVITKHFPAPSTLPAAFHPFFTQYDTYLLSLDEIVAK